MVVGWSRHSGRTRLGDGTFVPFAPCPAGEGPGGSWPRLVVCPHGYECAKTGTGNKIRCRVHPSPHGSAVPAGRGTGIHVEARLHGGCLEILGRPLVGRIVTGSRHATWLRLTPCGPAQCYLVYRQDASQTKTEDCHPVTCSAVQRTYGGDVPPKWTKGNRAQIQSMEAVHSPPLVHRGVCLVGGRGLGYA